MGGVAVRPLAGMVRTAGPGHALDDLVVGRYRICDQGVEHQRFHTLGVLECELASGLRGGAVTLDDPAFHPESLHNGVESFGQTGRGRQAGIQSLRLDPASARGDRGEDLVIALPGRCVAQRVDLGQSKDGSEWPVPGRSTMYTRREVRWATARCHRSQEPHRGRRR